MQVVKFHVPLQKESMLLTNKHRFIAETVLRLLVTLRLRSRGFVG